jgi:hypothetical protein
MVCGTATGRLRLCLKGFQDSQSILNHLSSRNLSNCVPVNDNVVARLLVDDIAARIGTSGRRRVNIAGFIGASECKVRH